MNAYNWLMCGCLLTILLMAKFITEDDPICQAISKLVITLAVICVALIWRANS